MQPCHPVRGRPRPSAHPHAAPLHADGIPLRPGHALPRRRHSEQTHRPLARHPPRARSATHQNLAYSQIAPL
ncbi:MAG: hypothetical protein FJW36_12015 [Acidobacteria bacterium]|nr:hypothetical protein [Acidobacteriota bacterium]